MNDIFDYDFFDDAIEDVDMYDDDYDDAYEDVDVFDEDYFEAMEGPARDYRRENNKEKTRRQIRKERENNHNNSYGPASTDFNPKDRLNNNTPKWQRYGNHKYNSKYNVGPNTIKRTSVDKDGEHSEQTTQRLVMDARSQGVGYKTYVFK